MQAQEGCRDEVVAAPSNICLVPGAAVRRGAPSPLGTYEVEGGVNFSLFSRDATRVRLELFAHVSDLKPERIFELDPSRNRTEDIWHIWVKDVRPGQLYAYRVGGPYDPEAGQLFNFDELLLDPYATAIARSREGAAKCVVACVEFDWGDDQPPRHSWANTVIYETHVRGLTAHSSSGAQFPGTYRGLIEKIPYFEQLGVTAVELLPVQEFNATESHRGKSLEIRAPVNYWGYEPIAPFAPNGAYSSAGDRGQQILEFKEMVRELHAAGIEVILDVVFGHGAQFCGGNTLDTCHPAVRELFFNVLRYWVAEMHVDGFRLDLAAGLGRDCAGGLLPNRQLLERIAEDPILRDVKLIAQGWGAAGAYEVTTYSGRRWAEWNVRYRDDVRRFWRGDDGMLGKFASRLCGSEDLYGKSGKGPECGINLISCHDGFTLNDLVSFHNKHNLENGQGNRDGAAENYGANYGTEGPTDDPGIEAVRTRQVKNFILTLFVSRGVPMLLGGDEFRRTQHGNNNAHCQDNATSWYDWRRLQQYPDVHDFVVRMARLRAAFPSLSRERFYTSHDISWFSAGAGAPDWSDPHGKSLGCLIQDSHDALYLMFNAEDKPMSFTIPAASNGRRWRLAADTSRGLPVGCAGEAAGSMIEHDRPYVLEPHSSALLTATAVTTGGCDPSIDYCAATMAGGDPAVAYAAAMLWYQGYPDPAEDGLKEDAAPEQGVRSFP